MSELTLSYLGAFQATFDGRPLTHFRSNRVQALLIYLTVDRSQPHRREALMELLWPGLLPKSAQVNLRQTLYQLRKLIPEVKSDDVSLAVPFLLADRQSVQVNPQAVFKLDVATFERLARGEPNCDSVTAATHLYRGDFVSDFYLPDSALFEAWLGARREAYRRQAIGLFDALIALLLAGETGVAAEKDSLQQALQAAERLLAIDPLHERGHRQLMTILARQGKRGRALAHYDTLCQLLRAEVDADPAPKTQALVEQIRRAELGTTVRAMQRVRGYTLGEEVGSGTFGIVYRAQQPAVGREVAVKVITPAYASQPDFIRRFEAEARIVARLEHPYIVPLYDYWREPEGAYLVMRYLRGGNLHDLLAQGPCDLATAVRVMDQVTAALAVAHRRGVVHRDIKPANILLDEEGNAYLSDFGIAKELAGEGELTQAGQLVGSPAYVAPEQALGQTVSPQTDIYNLGVVLYEMFTGEHPFSATPVSDLLYKHTHERLPSMREKAPALPEAVDDIIQRATAKAPAGRFADSRALARALAATLPGRGSAVAIEQAERELVNPYKGLRPFEEADAGDFFGRAELVEGLLARLAEHGHAARFLAVVGPSGSGKSSAVKAGLLPALRGGALPGSAAWYVVNLTPGGRPVDELEIGLLRVAAQQPAGLGEQLARDEHGLMRAARLILPDDEATLLLVIDQFEELFTAVADANERDHFLSLLATAVSGTGGQVRVVVTLRADFYDRPLLHTAFGQLMRDRTAVVLPLTAAELAEAIREPALGAGAELETGLVTDIVADVAEETGALPMLQYALTELFTQRDGRMLTRKAYQAIGGVSGALARRAEEVYGELGEPAQRMARQLFLRLVTLGEGVEDTRRRVLQSELTQLEDGRPKANKRVTQNSQDVVIAALLERYGQARLLTFDRDPETREPTVEVAHEALLRQWPRLRGWLDESRDDIRLQRLLAAAMGEWQAGGRDDDYLLRGARLHRFSGWAETQPIALTRDEESYLQNSFVQAAARERRARRRRNAVVGAIALVAIVMAVLALWANTQRSRALAAEEDALRQAAILLAGQAESELEDGYHDRAVLLALEALGRFPYTPQAERALGQAVSSNRALELYEGHSSAATSVAWSPDGGLIASSSGIDNNVHIWDPETGQTLRVLGLPTGITGNVFDMALHVSWTADGERLLVIAGDRYLLGSQDFDILFLDAASGELLGSVEIPNRAEPASGELRASFYLYPTGAAAAIAPGGDRLATLGGDNTALIWDAAWQQPELVLQGHTDAVNSVAWSPDGAELVTTSMDGTVRTWDARTGNEMLRLEAHEGWVTHALWSPVGDLLATAGTDGTIGLWQPGNGALVRLLKPETESVWSLAWSPDGARLISGHDDGRLGIWDVASGDLLEILAGNEGMISDLAWSPTDNRLASSDNSGFVRVWNVATSTAWRTFPISYAQGIDWSSDGRYLAIAGGDVIGDAEPPSFVIWEVEPDKIALERLASELNYDALYTYFSPDDRQILFGGLAGFPDISGLSSVYALDPWTGAFLRTFTIGDKLARSYNWSPDGSQVAVGMFLGNEVWIWDYSSGEVVQTLSAGGPENGYNGVAWSPDGTKLAAAAFETIAPVWDAQTWEPLYTIAAHEKPAEIWSVNWSPDSSRLLTTAGSDEQGAKDNTARVWDANTGEELLVISGHTKSIQFGLWSADGERIMTASTDNTVRIWDANTGDELLRLSPPPAIYGLSVAWSPDGRYVATSGLGSLTSVWRVWPTTEDLLAYARECCAFRELTAAEREQFGLPERP